MSNAQYMYKKHTYTNEYVNDGQVGKNDIHRTIRIFFLFTFIEPMYQTCVCVCMCESLANYFFRASDGTTETVRRRGTHTKLVF